MRIQLPFLALSFFIGLNTANSQENTSAFDAYAAEADGYFTTFLPTPDGIVSTDNFASRIYLFDEGSYKPLFSSPGCGRYMHLSPDKKSIGFKYIQTDGKQAPALLNIHNQQVTFLNSPVDVCGQVSFSNNGKIAYTIGNELIIKHSGTEQRYPLGTYVNTAPISPDGNFVCYNDNYDQLFLLNLATNQTLKITSGEHGNIYPQWSPDGNKLLYSSLSGLLRVYDIEHQTTHTIATGYYASWMQDSRHLIYTSLENSNLKLEGSDIYKALYDGTGITNLTNSPGNYEIAGCTLWRWNHLPKPEL